jgi:hypothetical protein
MEIVLRVVATPLAKVLPGEFGPGKRFVFSDDLVLERIDNKTPGNGLPKKAKNRRAGTHSGFVTTLRGAKKNDVYLPPKSELLQYEATYRLTPVAGNPPPGMQKGQITVGGVLLIQQNGTLVDALGFAITGGTEAYATARGEATEPADKLKKLEIVL